ncbi:MAG TPA: sugar phosphate nucleotidyltransferase [Myxococcota bacterium]|nr:sugar phosphate nucleotidyltransferase [Myxococcota bacterium]HQK52321.1 sugar phosphate nucleotidyltransferase [Myxococcota bacterium]
MAEVLALILGGGQGKRLYPLTLMRAKPAVGVAGKYRLIDVTVSNCIHSGIRRVFVITQFLSASLHRHIHETYRFDPFSGGFVEILAAEQTPSRDSWYQGTADAVRESLRHVMRYRSDAVLILSGDHLYRMDYREMVGQHLSRSGDITLAVQPVTREDAPRMGLLRVDRFGMVCEFVEKPKDPDVIERFRAPAEVLHRCGMDDGEPRYLASMGIYTFRPHVLADSLADPSRMDFGREVIPAALGSYRVLAHPFAGHWEDIGTIRSFFDAHMKLLAPEPSFRLYQPGWPIFTHQRNLPPARVMDSTVRNSLLAEGADVTGATIHESVIGVRSIVRPGAVLNQVIMQGADYYEGEEPMHHLEEPLPGTVPMGIGEDCRLSRVILDKNCRIGAGTVIEPKPDDAEFEGPNYWVREGITVIPKGAVLEPGTRI